MNVESSTPEKAPLWSARRYPELWFVIGLVFATVDAIGSAMAMWGIFTPASALSLTLCVAGGLFLTALAVTTPVIRDRASRRARRQSQRRSAEQKGLTDALAMFSLRTLQTVLYLLFAFDIGTSILVFVWYGLARQPLSEPIDPTRLTWSFANVMPTAMGVAAVLFFFWICEQFGRSIDAFAQQRIEKLDADMRSATRRVAPVPSNDWDME